MKSSARTQCVLLSLLLSGCTNAIPTAWNSLMGRGDPNINSSPNIAVLGDSWGSGVAYLPSNAYDGNKDNCMRWDRAYAAQLEADKSWSGSKTNSMQFVACSGSKLFNIAKSPQHQIGKLTGKKDAIIMTSGGNDVGFFRVADACIYHSIRQNYGPQYPDQAGRCYEAIHFAETYIRDDFKNDLAATYQDMLISKPAQDNPNVRFYQTGYAQFFSTKGQGNEDWCEATQMSFNAPFINLGSGNPGSYLSNQVRTRINDLVDQVNNAIRDVTEQFKNNFGFIDINPVFENHRFCEVGSDNSKEYYSGDVWLWNIVVPGFGAGTQNPPPKPADFDTNPDYQFGQQAITQQDLIGGIEILSNPSGASNSILDGWKLRPFHPKGQAYGAIKNLIVQRLIADDIPGAATTIRDPPCTNHAACPNA